MKRFFFISIASLLSVFLITPPAFALQSPSYSITTLEIGGQAYARMTSPHYSVQRSADSTQTVPALPLQSGGGNGRRTSLTASTTKLVPSVLGTATTTVPVAAESLFDTLQREVRENALYAPIHRAAQLTPQVEGDTKRVSISSASPAGEYQESDLDNMQNVAFFDTFSHRFYFLLLVLSMLYMIRRHTAVGKRWSPF